MRIAPACVADVIVNALRIVRMGLKVLIIINDRA